MIKNIFIFSLAFLLITSCSNESEKEDLGNETEENASELPKQNLEDNFQISGIIEGSVNQPLSLEAISNKGVIKLAQTTVGQDGSFVLKGNIQGMGMYQVRLGLMDNKIIPLVLEPSDKVVLKANYEKFELLPTWSGTKWSEPLTKYMAIYNDFALNQMELSKNAKLKNLTEEQQLKQFFQMKKPMDDFAKNTILKDLSNPVNMILTNSLTPAMGFENWDEGYLSVLKKVSFAYNEKYKNSPIAASLQNQVNEIEKALNEYKLTKSGNKLAPEISLKNPSGKTMTLSSLRGKVVLIDFWASWCGPCRRESPNVVKMYNKYKDRGFTVFSVSLDDDAEAWKRAIKSDGLVWPYHVSDLLKWETPLKESYGFNSIPYTVLVGKDGKILGTNLRGESLEQKLKEVL